MLATVAASAVFWSPLLVSHGSRVLRPGADLPLGGYTARGSAVSQPGGDDLFVRCILLEQGDLRVAVVGFDGLTVPESLRREVSRRLPGGTNLMLVATHTHCAPDTQMLNEAMTFRIPGIATFSRRWLDWYAGQTAGLVDIVSRSKRSLAAPRLRSGTLDANRPRRAGGTPDKRVWSVDLAEGSRIVSYSAHATVFGSERLQTSGDWPGAVARAGGGAVVLPGAIGDVSPAMDGGGPEERCGRIARALLDLVERSSAQGLDSELGWGTEPILLGKVVAHPDFAKENRTSDAMAALAVTKFAPRRASVTALRIGKFVILGVPGEPTGALGKRLGGAFESRGMECLVVSHCNGWIGYILEASDYARGGYEATLSFHGPGTADRVFEAADRLAARMAGQRPAPSR